MPVSVSIEASPAVAGALASGIDGALLVLPVGAPGVECRIVVHDPPAVDALACLSALDAAIEAPPVVVLAPGASQCLRRSLLAAGAAEVVDAAPPPAAAIIDAVGDALVRGRATRAARRTDHYLRQLVEHSPNLVAVAGLDGRLEYMNPGGREMVGLAGDGDPSAHHVGDYVAAGEQARLRAGLDAVFAGGEWHGEMQLRHLATGMPVNVFRSTFLLRDPATGVPSGFGTIARDITAQHAAELALRRSDARYRALLDAVEEGFCLLDVTFDASGRRGVDYRFVEVNRAFVRQTGLEDAVGRRIADLVPDIDPSWAEAYGQVASTGEPARFERHDAALGRWFEVEATPIDPAPGRRVAVLLRDITARKQADEALRRSEARFKLLFDTNLLGILFWTFDGGVHGANDEFLRLVGDDRADLEAGAINWSAMTPPEHQAQDARAIDELRRTGRHAPIEKEYVRKDGSRVWVLVGSAFSAEDDGVGFVLDISRQKQAEASLLAMNERLREADRRKDEFIGVLAHELRNPLAPVRLAVEILRRTGPADAHLEKVRDIIDRQVSHMARLIDDLLDVSRIARGKLSLRRERCDVAAIACQTAEDYRSSLDAAGIVLALHDCGSPAWVDGDPVRLAQMVGNLLHNASRFTDHGGRVTVGVEADDARREAVIRVEDTGVGIEPALLARLFDPFSQADQDLARSKGGLGLGLALTKGLAELHGGSVEAHSAGVGRGATFVLRLPLAAVATGPTVSTPVRARPVPRRRILVVEDNRDAAVTLGELLQLAGHEVRLAFDGTSAATAAREFRPHVVISDIGLPGAVDGYGVARALRADPALRHVHLIALSGYANDEARRQSLAAGFDAHLAKPPDLAALELTIAAADGLTDREPGR